MTDEGGLAAAVLADEGHAFAGPDADVDAIKSPHAALAVDMGEALDDELSH